MADAQVKNKQRNALATLRKFSAAGRMAETDEGIEAAVKCARCVNRREPCFVWKDVIKTEACANCKRNGKSNCEAAAVVEEEEVSVKDELRELRSEFKELKHSLAAAVTEGLAAVRKLGVVQDDLAVVKRDLVLFEDEARKQFHVINLVCDKF